VDSRVAGFASSLQPVYLLAVPPAHSHYVHHRKNAAGPQDASHLADHLARPEDVSKTKGSVANVEIFGSKRQVNPVSLEEYDVRPCASPASRLQHGCGYVQAHNHASALGQQIGIVPQPAREIEHSCVARVWKAVENFLRPRVPFTLRNTLVAASDQI